MSIIHAMYTGASGLNSMAQAMSVIGNNLSNASTTGFKGAIANFADILSQNIGTTQASGITQMGNGVHLDGVSRNSRQGSFQMTDNTSDMAINGQGYFIVKDYSNENSTKTYYTRAGDFVKLTESTVGDADLETIKLSTKRGMVLQGWELDNTGAQVSSALTDVDISPSRILSLAQPTTTVTMSVNLDAEDEDLSGTSYDPNNSQTYNFSTGARIYDNQGEGHDVEVQFRKIGSLQWEWHVALPSSDLDSTQRGIGNLTAVDDTDLDGILDEGTHVRAAISSEYTTGLLTFTPSGQLKTEGSTPITFNWNNAVTPQEVLFDFGDAMGDALGQAHTADSTNDYTGFDLTPTSSTYMTFAAATAADDTGTTGGLGTVQYAAGYSTLEVSQDGFPEGRLDRITMNTAGVMTGHFSNGTSRSLYQLPVALFTNPLGLEAKGNNLFVATPYSGTRTVAVAGQGGAGKMTGGAIEHSNVDMAEEFTRMIALQRTYQANARIITITDEMTQVVRDMKK
ncbi:MAG: flagellar hook protein FlgE [Magnetococcales bacterium]|nr:flagellar hook protein FlgE [Magnetococcales bacterium]